MKAGNDIQSLRAAVCDLNGVMRGKRIPVEQARKALEGKLRMPYSLIGLDIWGEDIEGDTPGFLDRRRRRALPMDGTRHSPGGLDGASDGACPALARR